MTADHVYDQVPYSNHPYAQTHPDRLATVAILHGLEPPDPFARARIGARLRRGREPAGDGRRHARASARSASTSRASRSRRARGRGRGIGAGQRRAPPGRRARADRRRTSASSTTSSPTASTAGSRRTRATRCWPRSPPSLAPDGVAYVSYNAHPGGYFRRMLRDAGLWHARGIEDQARAARARRRSSTSSCMEQRATEADTYGAVLFKTLPALAEGPLWRLVHDDLSEHWDPSWFAEFAAHAARARAGLRRRGRPLRPARRGAARTASSEQVWELAGGDRTAFETLTDLMTGRAVPPERALPRRAGRSPSSRRRSARRGCTGPRARTPSRSRSGWWPTRSPCSTASARTPSRSPTCTPSWARDADDARRGAAGRLPARAADPARRPAARRARAGRAPARLGARPLAGRAASWR